MDRLYPIALVLIIVLAGCKESAETVAPIRSSRVNAVRAKPKAEVPKPEAFCDVYHPAATAPDWIMPPLVKPGPAPSKGWRWINVWATWCEPCVEELPRMARWAKKLRSDGLGEIVLVSADMSDAIVDGFRTKHPSMPSTLRVETPDAIQPWLESLGFDKGSALPLHVFVDPAGKVRCLRAGGVSEAEFAAVKGVLTAP